MKTYTLEQLQVMKPHERAVLYQNAVKRRVVGGQAIIDLIDQSGLPLSSGNLTFDNPVHLEMEATIWSMDGRKAAIEATEKGLPALAGVDPLLSAKLGELYMPHDGGTVNAGFLMAELMRHLGYVENGQGKMPEG